MYLRSCFISEAEGDEKPVDSGSESEAGPNSLWSESGEEKSSVAEEIFVQKDSEDSCEALMELGFVSIVRKNFLDSEDAIDIPLKDNFLQKCKFYEPLNLCTTNLNPWVPFGGNNLGKMSIFVKIKNMFYYWEIGQI